MNDTLDILKISWSCWALIASGYLILQGGRTVFRWEGSIGNLAEWFVASFLTSAFVLLAVPLILALIGIKGIGAFYTAYLWLAVLGTGAILIPIGKVLYSRRQAASFSGLNIRSGTIPTATFVTLVVFLIGLLILFGTFYPKMNWDATNFFLPAAMHVLQVDHIPRDYPLSFYPLDVPFVPISYNYTIFLSYFLHSSELLSSDLDVIHFLDRTNVYLGIVPAFLLMVWSVVIYLYARMVLRFRFGAWLALVMALSTLSGLSYGRRPTRSRSTTDTNR